MKLEKLSSGKLMRLISQAQQILAHRRTHCDHLFKYHAIGDPSIGGTMFSQWYECVKCGYERSAHE
jgi:hypothetical protein